MRGIYLAFPFANSIQKHLRISDEMYTYSPTPTRVNIDKIYSIKNSTNQFSLLIKVNIYFF